MKVLVTGVDGYIGVLLAPLLLARGYDVIGLDTGYYRDGKLYDNGTVNLLAYLHKDIRHITVEDLQEVAAVVHLAELSNDPLGELRPNITYDINHMGTIEFARKCKLAGVTRFVYSSSCSVYGVGTDELQTETSLPNPQTAYAKCKVLVEQELAALADDDFSPTILRNATAYGPSPRMRFDLVLNNLAGYAWTTGEIRMQSDGTPWRPLVHVLDTCEAIARTLEAPRVVVHNQIFNVGETNENYQVKDIAQIVALTFSGCKLTLGTSNGDNRSYRVSFEKIHASLPGFRCQRDAKMGANQLLEVFKRINMSQEIFEFRGFARLNQLKYLLQTRKIDDSFFWT